MTNLLSFSKSIYSQRRPNTGSYAVGSGDYLFALGPAVSPKFGWANDTFTINSTDYVEGIGWAEGDYQTVRQDIDLTGIDSINLVGKAQAPDGKISGNPYSGSTSELYWEFSVFLAGSVVFRKKLDNRIFDLSHITILTTHINAVKAISFRLRLTS